jgi:RNA polymerase sigma-70 factor, ECF subfamily
MALYSVYQRRLYLYALTLLPSSHDAEDVFQAANLVLWRKFDQYQAGTNFYAWACKIIRYEVLKYHERIPRALAILDPDVIDRLADVAVVQIGYLDEPYRRAFLDCMSKLGVTDRKLMDQRYTAGMAVQEIAVATHRSPNGVSQSLGRIRRFLLDCINKTVNDVSEPGGER